MLLPILELRHDDFYVVESSPEGKRFVSARSWSELSDLMTLLEHLDLTVDAGVIEQYVQHPEVAARFAAYYELFAKYRSDYQIEAILAGETPGEIVQRAAAAPFDELLALLSLLLEALENDMRSQLERRAALAEVRATLRRVLGECKRADTNAVTVEHSDDDTHLDDDTHSDDRSGFKACLLRDAERKRTKAQRNANANARRTGVLAATLLERMAQADGIDSAIDEYRLLVDRLDADIERTCSKLECAFSFVEDTFGTGSEMLVFTTELTARRDPAQFIAQFGSESYFKYSSALSTETERDAIFDEIDALELDARS